jgi:hypothetical protein
MCTRILSLETVPEYIQSRSSEIYQKLIRTRLEFSTQQDSFLMNLNLVLNFINNIQLATSSCKRLFSPTPVVAGLRCTYYWAPQYLESQFRILLGKISLISVRRPVMAVVKQWFHPLSKEHYP